MGFSSTFRIMGFFGFRTPVFEKHSANAWGISFWVEIFLQVSGMAVGTHTIPVLTSSCPVKPLFMIYRHFSIKVIPCFFLGIPSDMKTLFTAIGKFNDVLLEWVNSKCISNFELLHLTGSIFS